jgi:L,D-peptidoglycan transpeptidase YkuD (ErfK/YbiS/YcfS/YnhG family)
MHHYRKIAQREISASSGSGPGRGNRNNGIVVVRRAPGRLAHRGLLAAGGRVFPCALGHGGIRAIKREGDGVTPRATLRIVGGYARHDRLAVRPAFRWLTPITKSSGWCDDPRSAVYNRPVRLPHSGSHEAMRRDDHLYDICLVLDWNLAPRSRFRGSAIFLHQWSRGRPTEGCIALDPATLAKLLHLLRPGTQVRIGG